MIVSVNQPAYLPWLGYFHRIAVSDVHVVLDQVQYEKNSFTNRNKVRTSTGSCWITVPVRTGGRFGVAIRDLEIDNGTAWRRKHRDTLRQYYARAPFFGEHASFVADIFQREWTRLADLCDVATTYLLGTLGIRTRIVSSSSLGITGVKDALVLNLCRALGATTYVSGAFGRRYLREESFREVGIDLIYQSYQHPVYPQVYQPFEPSLSIVDLLFNCGPRSLEVLTRDQLPVAV
jgi:hypothetical protein